MWVCAVRSAIGVQVLGKGGVWRRTQLQTRLYCSSLHKSNLFWLNNHLKAGRVRQRHAALNEAPMGKNGQLDKPTQARLLSYFSVQEHAAGKDTAKCQVCIGTILRKVSIGRVLGRFVAGVSGANTCDYVNNVSRNDYTLFHKAAELSERDD